MAHSTWQVKLSDRSLTRVVPERVRDEQLIIKRYTNDAFFYCNGVFRKFKYN